MKVFYHLFMILLLLSSVFFGGNSRAQSIPDDIAALRAKGMGTQTDYAAVEKQAAEMIQRYQGLVYDEMAVMEAQGGVSRAQKVLEYAEKADAAPLGPEQKVQLHVYWGDSIRQLNTPLTDAARKEAAAIYLSGYAIAIKENLPEKVSAELPIVSRLDFEGDPASPAYKAAMAAHDKEVSDREKARHTRDMIQMRDTLKRQIVDLYAPRDKAQELKELAEKESIPPAAVVQLLKAVSEAQDAAKPRK